MITTRTIQCNEIITYLESLKLTPLFQLQDSAAPDGKSEISIEKLESQLNTLKTMFAEKQKLVADLEVYGGGHAPPAPVTPTPEVVPADLPVEVPKEAPVDAPAEETAAT